MADTVSNGTLSHKQLVDLIKQGLVFGGIDLIDEKQLDNTFYQFTALVNGKKKTLDLLLKNIVNSGWSDKPFIKRIQVKSFKSEELTINTTDTCSAFVGAGFVNGSPIFVIWNPFMFVYHSTIRSCYIDVHLMVRCCHEGMIKTTCSKQKVILASLGNLSEALKVYLEDNAVAQL